MARDVAAQSREMERVALWVLMESWRVVRWEGREGIVRWMKEGFVVGAAMRARWMAEVWRLEETRVASVER